MKKKIPNICAIKARGLFLLLEAFRSTFFSTGHVPCFRGELMILEAIGQEGLGISKIALGHHAAHGLCDFYTCHKTRGKRVV